MDDIPIRVGGSLNRLTNPPLGIRSEADVSAPVELGGRPDQSDVAVLNPAATESRAVAPTQ